VASLHRLALDVFARLPRRGQIAVVHATSPTYSLGALAVVFRSDGRVLLVRQSYRPGWSLPGGLSARHERPENTVVREVREETGLAIDVTGEPTTDVDYNNRKVDLIYPARPADGADPDAARPGSVEIVECRWFAVDDLPTLQTEAAAGLARFTPTVD
jgi:8-oxo-dGTP pyrophosphatase MutT (NUDIX family)